MLTFVYYLASFLAVTFVITFHEFAHAYAADKSGDPTPRLYGRLTLNPIKHFDPIGLFMFICVGFGWAKPVPINPYNFKNYKQGIIVTSSAGVIVNYLTAFLCYPLIILFMQYVAPLVAGTYAAQFLYYLPNLVYVYSLSFCVFNLLPFYPLDGFRIFDATVNGRGKVYQFLREYGHKILLGLMVLSLLSDYLVILAPFDILGYVMRFAKNVLGWPISAFWNMIFNIGFAI